MGRQYNKTEKAGRRKAYLKRKGAAVKALKAGPKAAAAA